MKISGGNIADASDWNFRGAYGVSKGNAGKDGDLVARIQTVDIQAGIRLSIAGRLRLFQRVGKFNAVLLHLRKDVIARAVHNSVDSLDAVRGERFRDRADLRNSARDRGFNSYREIFLLGKSKELIAMQSDKRFVRGHYGLAIF